MSAFDLHVTRTNRVSSQFLSLSFLRNNIEQQSYKIAIDNAIKNEN